MSGGCTSAASVPVFVNTTIAVIKLDVGAAYYDLMYYVPMYLSDYPEDITNYPTYASGGPITGRVTDVNGEGIEGKFVSCGTNGTFYVTSPLEFASSDASGIIAVDMEVCWLSWQRNCAGYWGFCWTS